MKIRMMLTHNLMACYATTLTELREESKKRKRTTLRQKENRHGWRIRRRSPTRNDMGHSQRVESDTLTESQSGLFPPYRELRENYAKTA